MSAFNGDLTGSKSMPAIYGPKELASVQTSVHRMRASKDCPLTGGDFVYASDFDATVDYAVVRIAELKADLIGVRHINRLLAASMAEAQDLIRRYKEELARLRDSPSSDSEKA